MKKKPYVCNNQKKYIQLKKPTLMKLKRYNQMFENLSNDKFELIGNSIDEVLDAINTLKFHYGNDYVIVEDESGHGSGDKFGVYVSFSDDIKLRSGGENPSSNIVQEMNYILEEEMKTPKLYKI